MATKPTIADLIDQIGLGPTQLRFIFSGGGVWFADGIELSLISSISIAVSSTFHVGAAARGMLVTIVYFGVFLGNLVSGPVSDRYGRRSCILGSYLCIFIFSVLSSFAPSYASLLLIRFTVGVSFGFGQPVWNTLSTEISPTDWRTLINAVSQSLFSIGEVYCYILVYLDDPSMRHLQWRMLLRQGAIPSLVFFVVACIWLLQSPFYLAMNGETRQARDVLVTMQRDNCIPELSLEFRQPEVEDSAEDQSTSCSSELQVVFSSSLIVTTLIVAYSCFVMNLVYYGALYAFPQVLPGMSQLGHSISPAMESIIGACWELPGYAIAVVFAKFLARKPAIKLYCLICAISMILFAVGAWLNLSMVWHIGYYGVKCSVQIGFVVVYVYMSEVYPTKVRVTGCSVSMAGGRFGSMLAPLAFEMLTAWTGTYIVFFLVLCALLLSNMPLIDLLPLETFNAPLSSICDDTKSS